MSSSNYRGRNPSNSFATDDYNNRNSNNKDLQHFDPVQPNVYNNKQRQNTNAGYNSNRVSVNEHSFRDRPDVLKSPRETGYSIKISHVRDLSRGNKFDSQMGDSQNTVNEINIRENNALIQYQNENIQEDFEETSKFPNTVRYMDDYVNSSNKSPGQETQSFNQYNSRAKPDSDLESRGRRFSDRHNDMNFNRKTSLRKSRKNSNQRVSPIQSSSNYKRLLGDIPENEAKEDINGRLTKNTITSHLNFNKSISISEVDNTPSANKDINMTGNFHNLRNEEQLNESRNINKKRNS